MSPHYGVIVTLVVASLPVRADEKQAPRKALRLELAPKAKAVKAGEKPVFVLTVENRGTEPQRLLNGNIPRLQATWYRLEVTQGGKPAGIGEKLFGVPYSDEGDYVTLKPGEKVEFELTRFIASVESLRPGKYEARFEFSTSPKVGDGEFYKSPPAEFTIEK
jgi:hypothetical protein